MIVFPEAFIINGWTFYEKCKCQRIKKYKFRNTAFPKLELEWWINYYQFKIMDGNTTKIPLTKIGLADQTLKSL